MSHKKGQAFTSQEELLRWCLKKKPYYFKRLGTIEFYDNLTTDGYYSDMNDWNNHHKAIPTGESFSLEERVEDLETLKDGFPRLSDMSDICLRLERLEETVDQNERLINSLVGETLDIESSEPCTPKLTAEEWMQQEGNIPRDEYFYVDMLEAFSQGKKNCGCVKQPSKEIEFLGDEDLTKEAYEVLPEDNFMDESGHSNAIFIKGFCEGYHYLQEQIERKGDE